MNVSFLYSKSPEYAVWREEVIRKSFLGCKVNLEAECEVELLAKHQLESALLKCKLWFRSVPAMIVSSDFLMEWLCC